MNISDFFKRLLWSVLTIPLTAAVSYFVEGALKAWGVLEPLAAQLGDWLKVHITPQQISWTVSALLALIAYVFVIWLIWRHYRSPVMPELQAAGFTDEHLNKSSLQLEVGEDGEFFETDSKSLYTTFKTLKLRLRNVDRRKSMSNCKVQLLDIILKEYTGPWLLKEAFSLAAGDQEFIPFIRYQEAREFDKNPTYAATFMEVLTSKNSPLPPADKRHILTIRATALESAYSDIQCQVWTEAGRLRIAPLIPESRPTQDVAIIGGFQEVPAQFYKGIWIYKMLAQLPFFNEKAKLRLKWLAEWERFHSEVPLIEAATRAYELTRKTSAGKHAKILAKTDNDIITWYCYAMTMPRDGRPPLVALKGVHPPSRLIEPVDVSALASFDYAIEDYELLLKERFGRGRIHTLRVNSREAESAIAQISSWSGVRASDA